MPRYAALILVLAACTRRAPVRDKRDEQVTPLAPTYRYTEHQGYSAVADLYQQASELRRRGDYEGSCKLYATAEARKPEEPMGHVGLGSCALHRNQLDEAEREYQRAQTLDPGYIGARVGLGSVAALRGKHREAARWFESALALDETSADAHWGAALAYQQIGDTAAARRHARRFLELAPGSALAPQARQIADGL